MNPSENLPELLSSLNLSDQTGRYLLAALAASALYALAKNRRSLGGQTRRLVTAGVGGAGFLLGIFAGMATVAAVVAYRAGRAAPARTKFLVVPGVFAAVAAAELAVYFYLVPGARESATGLVKTSAPWLVGAVVVVVALVAVLAYLRRPASAYHGAGPQAFEVPLDQRDPRRDFNEDERLEIIEANGGICALPGCTARHGDPGVRLEADHRHPWSMGGPTTVENGQPLCGPHNRQKGAKTTEQYLAWRALNPDRAF